ncbi:hypothetical protein Goshw_001952 [Gossypium schwendimanii]|uniref:RNase H type-1 domain-containing protein n=1 Tax=Gossypium schwendimanii TaxID=34291 RepID=A0A7J9LJQ0_GOSSC|nr:hypothetical protein [Gossypium schwendimanii]
MIGKLRENTEYPIGAVRVTEQVKMVIREIWRVYSAQWVRRLVNDDVCLRCGEAAETTSHACEDCLCAVKVNFDGGFYNDLEASSSGIIIRDNKGLMMGATCNWSRNIPSVEVTEALEGGLPADEEGLHSEARCSWVKEGPVAIREIVVVEERNLCRTT